MLHFFFRASQLLSVIVLMAVQVASAQVRVSGYHRKDGTYVKPHYRSNPDGNFWNNWSTIGNTNPFTGKAGTRVSPPPGYGQKDRDIPFRRSDGTYVKPHLLIDVDPIHRTSRFRSGKTKKSVAYERALEIAYYIVGDLKLPRPILRDSGNGFHLLLLFDDIPRSPELDSFCKKLSAVIKEFSDVRVKVQVYVDESPPRCVVRAGRFAPSYGQDVYVDGYRRSDGTYAKPHYRSNPDGDFWNNWNTAGNTNPYTGRAGTRVSPVPRYGGHVNVGRHRGLHYVKPHYRSAPDGEPSNNWSMRGYPDRYAGEAIASVSHAVERRGGGRVEGDRSFAWNSASPQSHVAPHEKALHNRGTNRHATPHAGTWLSPKRSFLQHFLPRR